MPDAYEIRAVGPEVLDQLRARDDAGQQPRLQVDEEGGSPLRCCLRPARSGEKVALVAYAPLRRWAAQAGVTPGPYDEVGPVFIHPLPCPGPAHPGFPAELARSRRVVRAYAPDGRITGGRLVEPDQSGHTVPAAAALAEVLADPGVAFAHVRAVEFGCFLFEARRP